MAVPLNEINLSEKAEGYTVKYDLVGPLGVAHSAHPKYWESPAHIVFRNDSSAVLFCYLDDCGYQQSIAPNSTTTVPAPPTTNSFSVVVEGSVTDAGGSPVGASNYLYPTYYYPYENLPHSFGR